MVQRFAKTAVATGIPFGVLMGLYWAFISNATLGLILGAFCGMAFGLVMAGFMEFQRTRLEARSKVFEGEPVLHQGPANHFLGAESRGGWLTLTPTRLSFRSHGANFQNQPVDIPLSEIISAHPSRTLGVVPNGLKVKTRLGTESYVVGGRKVWARLVTEAARTGGRPTLPDPGHSGQPRWPHRSA